MVGLDHLSERKTTSYFFLFNIYGIFFLGLFGFSDIFFLIQIAQNIEIIHQFIFGLILFTLCLSFWILVVSFSCNVCIGIFQNQTQYERMKKTKNPYTRCSSNWEQVFGSFHKKINWICPIPAFAGLDDSEIFDNLDYKLL